MPEQHRQQQTQLRQQAPGMQALQIDAELDAFHTICHALLVLVCTCVGVLLCVCVCVCVVLL